MGNLKVRMLEEDNVLLAKWLSDPSVLEFYEGRDNPFNLDKVNEVFYPPEDEEVRSNVNLEYQKVHFLHL